MNEQPQGKPVPFDEHQAVIAFYKKVIVHLYSTISDLRNDAAATSSGGEAATDVSAVNIEGENVIVVDFRPRN